MNDAEMLSMAGKGCIMGSAHQRLKDLHPELEVIGTNATTRCRIICVNSIYRNRSLFGQLST